MLYNREAIFKSMMIQFADSHMHLGFTFINSSLPYTDKLWLNWKFWCQNYLLEWKYIQVERCIISTLVDLHIVFKIVTQIYWWFLTSGPAEMAAILETKFQIWFHVWNPTHVIKGICTCPCSSAEDLDDNSSMRQQACGCVQYRISVRNSSWI